MQEQLNTALLVLIVGMLTVFTVLFLVVQTGRLLIFLVNKYGPTPQAIKRPVKRQKAQPVEESVFSKKKLAAIITAVDIVTEGKGRVTAIEGMK